MAAHASTANSTRSLQAKVTEKGGVSIYGLQRFPVTLYAEQWEALFANADKIRAFMVKNKDSLKTKADSVPADGRISL